MEIFRPTPSKKFPVVNSAGAKLTARNSCSFQHPSWNNLACICFKTPSMSLRPAVLRSRELLLKSESCIFCQSRQLLGPNQRYALQRTASYIKPHRLSPKNHQWTRNYATVDRMTPAQVRVEIDNRSRFSWFTAVRKEGILCTDASTAEAIFSDVRTRGDSIDVVSLAKSAWSYFDPGPESRY
jgi:hypothetical protein